MDYDACRQHVKTGDIFAFREYGPLSRFIQAWTQSTWNHVSVAWVFRGKLLMVEARALTGVSVRALSRALPADWISTPVADCDALESLLISRLGLPYDVDNAIRVGLGEEPTRGGEICSLLAEEALNAGGLNLPSRGMTPQALVSDLLDVGCTLERIR